MEEQKSRRVFLQQLAKGTVTGILAFGCLKYGKSLGLLQPDDQPNNKIPKVNPAFRVNVMKDGSVELYTHKSGGEKVTHTFKGFEAEMLLTIINNRDPRLYSTELALKFNISKTDFISLTESTLQSLENEGLIYYGETMLVKIQEKGNE